MKLPTAFAVLLFLAATAQAQTYPGYPYFQPYYPGTITQPYYQFYYPEAFGQNYYAQQDYLAAQQNADSLRQQVQQLTQEVTSLQAQLANAQNQLAQMRESETPQPSTSETTTPVVLVFKNGETLETRGYVVAGSTLWIQTASGREQIDVSSLNVPATQRENLRRGIRFPNLED
jgi:hypothetical protein